MTLLNKIPPVLRNISITKEPTAWVVLILFVGFIYAQWPKREPVIDVPVYVEQSLVPGFVIRWEGEPIQERTSDPEVWSFNLKRMTFLVQTDELDRDFAELVTAVAEQDRDAVGGAIQEPLQIEDAYISYSFFDAESRVQSHRWYLHEGNWIKVSILYKPSNKERVKRAAEFFAHVRIN